MVPWSMKGQNRSVKWIGRGEGREHQFIRVAYAIYGVQKSGFSLVLRDICSFILKISV